MVCVVVCCRLWFAFAVNLLCVNCCCRCLLLLVVAICWFFCCWLLVVVCGCLLVVVVRRASLFVDLLFEFVVWCRCQVLLSVACL